MITFLADIKRSVQSLVAAEEMFGQRMLDSSLSSLRKDDARQSIEVLHALQGMQNKLNHYRFTPAPPGQSDLTLSGVLVSVRLDLIVHANAKGTDQFGGGILRLSQDDADTDGAKAKRREMGLYVAALARMQADRNIDPSSKVANKLCMSIDVRHGEVFASSHSNVRRITDLENACQFIAALWPSIENT